MTRNMQNFEKSEETRTRGEGLPGQAFFLLGALADTIRLSAAASIYFTD